MNSPLGVKRSPSLESTSSIVIRGPEARTSASVAGSSLNPSEPEHDIYDCAAAFVTCPNCNKIGLQTISSTKGWWLVKTAASSMGGYESNLVSKLRAALACPDTPKGYIPFTPLEPIHYWRLQVPISLKFITRIVFRTSLKPEGGKCCKDTKGGEMLWLMEKEVSLMGKDIWGPESAVFWTAKFPAQLYPSTREESISAWYERRPPSLTQALHLTGYGQEVCNRLHLDFVQWCYPAQFMTRTSLCAYLIDIKWAKDWTHVLDYFRAFSQNNLPYIEFSEFIRGIAFMDNRTPHGSEQGRIRCEYIFKFYNSKPDGKLHEEDLRRLIADCANPHNQNLDHIMSAHGPLPWSLDTFMNVIGSMKIRGTSKLFRGASSFSASNQQSHFATRDVSASFASAFAPKRPEGRIRCADCKNIHYTAAIHSIQMSMHGIPTDPLLIQLEDNRRMPEALKRRSEALYASASPANILLHGLRDFAEVTGICKGVSHNLIIRSQHIAPHAVPQPLTPFWTHSPPDVVANTVINVCDQLVPIVSSESRLVKVIHPVTVIGPVGGSLKDIMTMERLFWRAGPSHEAPTYLFLGNYIGLAGESLEVLVYLLSLKLQTPHRVILIRGQFEHPSRSGELRQIMTQRLKNPELVGRVEKAIYSVLTNLPIAALIDNKILCVPSGIPTSIGALTQMEAPTEQVEHDILDGTPPAQEKSYIDFLNRHHLSHLIRGNDASAVEGVKLYANGRAISVFSCSNIKGTKHRAAVLTVDDNKIIPIQFFV